MNEIPMKEIPVGQAFVARPTSEYAVEWVVVEVGASGALLVVPADTSPAQGSADVVVSAREAGSPFTLRGRFALWVPAHLPEPGLFTRTVPESACRAVFAKHQAFRLGRLPGELFELETDDSFEYQQWLAEEIAPAHQALAAAACSVTQSEPAAKVPAPVPLTSRVPWAPALAAGLGAVGLGLVLWSFELRQRVAELSAPLANMGNVSVDVGDTLRSEQRVELPAGSARFILYLQLDGKAGRFERYRLEVRRPPDGRLVEAIDDLRKEPGGEVTVVLVAPRQTGETLELRVFGVELGAQTPLGTHQLTFNRQPPS